MGNRVDIRQIEAMNARAGRHFFDADTMRFFKSRVSETAAGLPGNDGWLFVTSEKDGWRGPRLYTVRWCDREGRIKTVGDFQEYQNGRQAWAAIGRMVKDWPKERPEGG